MTNVISLNEKRPLAENFEQASRVINKFDVRKYAMKGLIMREISLIALAKNIANVLISEKDLIKKDDIIFIAHTNLRHNFNDTSFPVGIDPDPKLIAAKIKIVKSTLLSMLESKIEYNLGYRR